MGEHFFLTGRGEVKAGAIKRIDKIASKHGASFVCAKLPGDGWRYWCASPNQGHPFDRATEIAVLRDLQRAGLADDTGLASSVIKGG